MIVALSISSINLLQLGKTPTQDRLVALMNIQRADISSVEVVVQAENEKILKGSLGSQLVSIKEVDPIVIEPDVAVAEILKLTVLAIEGLLQPVGLIRGDEKESGTLPWLVTEYVCDPTLDEFVNEHGETVGWEGMRIILLKVAKILEKSLEAGMIHAGLNLSSIVIDGDMEPKIIDFVGGVKYRSYKMMDTEWTAPESLSSSCDIYSFGILCYKVFGRISKPQQNKRKLQELEEHLEGSELIEALAPDWPHEMRRLIVSCTQVNPDDRINVQEVVSTLQSLSWAKAQLDSITNYLTRQATEAEDSSYEHAKRMVHLMTKGDIVISRGVMALVETILGNAESAVMWVESFSEPIETLPTIGGRALQHWACAKYCANLVKILVEREVDINQLDEDGESALHIASQTGGEELVPILLAVDGVNVNIRNSQEDTPLLHATRARNSGIVKLLLDAGARTSIENCKEQSPLLLAVKNGDAEIVRLLLSAGVNVNIETVTGKTPATVTAEHGHLELLKLLIQAGANVNVEDTSYGSPLYHAVENGHLEMVKFLLQEGASVRITTDRGNTPLHVVEDEAIAEVLLKAVPELEVTNNDDSTPLYRAALSGNLKLVKLLLDYGASVEFGSINILMAPFTRYVAPFGSSKTPFGSDSHNIEIVEILLDAGARVNVVNTQGSLLHMAVETGDTEVVKLLLNAGAEINIYDESKKRPLDFAMKIGNEGMVDFLKSFGAKQYAEGDFDLHIASKMGDYNQVVSLIKQGADVNAKEHNGWTALHYSVKNGHRKICKYLISAKAQVDIKNYEGHAPLFVAIAWRNLDIVRLLLRAGADVNTRSDYGITPLHNAAIIADLALMKILLEYGAAVNSKDALGGTALHYAVDHDVAFVLKLLNFGADVNIRDINNETPLHRAAQRKSWPAVYTLLNDGSDINARSLDGSTPLHAAVKENEEVIMRELIACQANVTTKDRYGNIPLHFAFFCSDRSLLSLLYNGVDVNEKNFLGNTPLHYFSQCCNVEGVNFLIKSGAQVNATNNSGDTPLHNAGRSGSSIEYVQVIWLLVHAGANVNAINNMGNTPLHHAASEGDMEAVSLLLDWGALADIENNRGLVAELAGSDSDSELESESDDNQSCIDV
ncbi:hypothetical protein K7432_014080 [Basidiobolus ranarum]|uniref:Protein kinase domain-containing protein n=1 Tax=Basidiobolus ranarum TaxID=34480 RepID=A0ABR2VQF6_9FUNG